MRVTVKFLRKYSFHRFGAVTQLDKNKAQDLKKRGIVEFI